MDGARPPNDLPAASAAAPDRAVLNQQRGTSGKLPMNAVGVYQQRPRTRALPPLTLIVLIAAVVVLVFMIGKILF